MKGVKRGAKVIAPVAGSFLRCLNSIRSQGPGTLTESLTCLAGIQVLEPHLLPPTRVHTLTGSQFTVKLGLEPRHSAMGNGFLKQCVNYYAKLISFSVDNTTRNSFQVQSVSHLCDASCLHILQSPILLKCQCCYSSPFRYPKIIHFLSQFHIQKRG